MSERLEDLAERLRAVAEDLDEEMFGQLQEAASKRQGRPPQDRRLLAARRAIERAINLLDEPNTERHDDA